MMNLEDPYDRLNRLEHNLEEAVNYLKELSFLLKSHSQCIEQMTGYFKPIAHRLDTQQVELNELRRRIEYIEAIND